MYFSDSIKLFLFVPHKEKMLKFRLDPKWYLLASVTIVGSLVDWLTKVWAVAHLHTGVPMRIFGEFGQFLLVFNKAAVFGLDPRRIFPSFPLHQVHFVFTAIAVVLVLGYFVTLKKSDAIMKWGISLVMPGAIGNLIDRIVFPGRGVVDFMQIDLKFWPFNPWPIFNMADVYITFGVILICINFLLDAKKQKEQPVSKAEIPESIK
jgi:signal peptidase II